MGVFATLATTLSFAIAADGLELAVIGRSGCPWCLRWDKEMLPIYPKTEVGKRAPLRHFSLDEGQPKSITLETPVRFTPTFILLKDGKEIGRITGYLNDAAFWGLLEPMVERSTLSQ